MTLNELMIHLESIKETHGGDIEVQANDECGDLVEVEENSVYAYNEQMTENGFKLIFDV